MAEYLALARLAMNDGMVEPNTKFNSDAVPGRFWKPLDKDAKAAVKARDEAAKAAAPSAAPDPRVDELEARLAEAEALAELRDAEIEELKAKLDAFDHDGDGKPGGPAPKEPAAA